MKKLVCTHWSPATYSEGKIYTLKDDVRNDGYGNLYQLEEYPVNSWISEEFIKSDFEPVENIKASIIMIYGDGREDTRYFTSEWRAIEFEAEVKRIIKKHNRKNAKARSLSQKLVDYRTEHGIQYQAA